MYRHRTEIRVRYGETDKMGYVYYGNYMLYYEVGRVEAIRSLGLTYKSLEDQGIIMPVTHLTSKFIRPAFYDDLLTVVTTINHWPEKQIIFEVEIFKQDGNLINIGEVKLCFINTIDGKKINTPPTILKKLRPYFEADYKKV
jgi:acyl-CoA thioester hydrolase